MAKNITLLGASYTGVPGVLLPQTGGGTALFTDVGDTTAVAADVAEGKVFFAADGSRQVGTSTGGTSEAITITDTLDTHGGTIREITGMTWYKKYLPPSAELVASASDIINLSTGTDWDSWTPSTTSHVLLAAGSTRAACNHTISGATDCQNVSAIGVAAYVTHYDYGTAAMAKAYQASRITYCIAYYAPMSVPEYSDNNYGNHGIMSSVRQIYYTSATAKSTYANSNYGIGPASGTWSVSSATSDSSRVIGFTRPAINARCNSTYFSTTAAGKIVSADSYIQCEYRIWTMPKEENPFYALFDYTNGVLW